jgi:hypothetical protein
MTIENEKKSIWKNGQPHPQQDSYDEEQRLHLPWLSIRIVLGFGRYQGT